jgi:hypothetical protein
VDRYVGNCMRCGQRSPLHIKVLLQELDSSFEERVQSRLVPGDCDEQLQV